MNERERMRRWQLAVGDEDAGAGANALSDRDRRLSAALSALYGTEPKKGKGGLGASAPRVARWLGDIREFFPSTLVQVIQKDAFERLNLKSLLMEPEFLETLEACISSPISCRCDRRSRRRPRVPPAWWCRGSSTIS